MGQFELFNKSFSTARALMLYDNGGMNTPKRPKRPADFVQKAYQVFQEAIGEAPKQPGPGDGSDAAPEA